MQVERLGDGLWRWSVEPERWSVYAETREAIVLVDAVLPGPGTADEARFLAALDRDVLRCGVPLRVVETSAGRGPDGARLLARYGAPRHDPGAEEDDRDPDEARH
jgi:hypothetical protein